jgi:hypothetical protein
MFPTLGACRYIDLHSPTLQIIIVRVLGSGIMVECFTIPILILALLSVVATMNRLPPLPLP